MSVQIRGVYKSLRRRRGAGRRRPHPGRGRAHCAARAQRLWEDNHAAGHRGLRAARHRRGLHRRRGRGRAGPQRRRPSGGGSAWCSSTSPCSPTSSSPATWPTDCGAAAGATAPNGSPPAGAGRPARARASACPTSCQAARPSGSPWPGHWHQSPAWCCSTSPSPASTSPCAPTCAPRSAASCATPASRRCWSPTTRARPCRWATAVAVMFDGRVVQSGSPEDLYRRPASVAVGAFLGEANAINGVARSGRLDTEIGVFDVSVGDGPAVALGAPRGHRHHRGPDRRRRHRRGQVLRARPACRRAAAVRPDARHPAAPPSSTDGGRGGARRRQSGRAHRGLFGALGREVAR